jgi:hypothetical protein
MNDDAMQLEIDKAREYARAVTDERVAQLEARLKEAEEDAERLAGAVEYFSDSRKWDVKTEYGPYGSYTVFIWKDDANPICYWDDELAAHEARKARV